MIDERAVLERSADDRWTVMLDPLRNTSFFVEQDSLWVTGEIKATLKNEVVEWFARNDPNHDATRHGSRFHRTTLMIVFSSEAAAVAFRLQFGCIVRKGHSVFSSGLV